MWEDSVSTNHQLFAKKTPNNEFFEFGHGPAQYSHMHAYLPTAFDNTLIGTSVINFTNDIPLLGSNPTPREASSRHRSRQRRGGDEGFVS